MGEAPQLQVSDLLEACYNRYSVSDVLAEQRRIVMLASPLLSAATTPSDIVRLMLVELRGSLSLSGGADPFLFLDNICLHEMWQNGLAVSSFSLAFAALLINFEMERSGRASSLLRMVHLRWGQPFQALYQEVKGTRLRLLLSATQLTSSSEAIARFKALRSTSFEELLGSALHPVPPASSKAEGAHPQAAVASRKVSVRN